MGEEKMKIFWLVTFMLSIFFTKSAMAGLFYMSEEAESAAVEAIKENDLEKLKAIVKKNKSNTDLIDVALTNDSVSERFVCRTEIVRFLIDAGHKPSKGGGGYKLDNEPLKKSTFNLCPDIFKMLLPKASDDEIAKATYAFRIADYEKIFETNEKYPGFYQNIGMEKFSENVKKIATLLKEQNEKFCKTPNPLNKNCEALDFMKNEVAQFKQREENKEYAESPEGILKSACFEIETIKSEKRIMENEKEIGKKSGYVDKKVLYDSGAIIVESEKELNTLKKLYSKKTGGKSMPIGQCSHF